MATQVQTFRLTVAMLRRIQKFAVTEREVAEYQQGFENNPATPMGLGPDSARVFYFNEQWRKKGASFSYRGSDRRYTITVPLRHAMEFRKLVDAFVLGARGYESPCCICSEPNVLASDTTNICRTCAGSFTLED